MSQEEVTNVLSGDIYSFNFNRSEKCDSNEKKKGGALPTRGCYAVDSAYCRRHVDLKYATGPHNNQIPGLESTIYFPPQSEILRLVFDL